MKRLAFMVSVMFLVVSALAITPSFQQGGVLDLNRDQVVPGGLDNETISKVVLPTFSAKAPKYASDEAIKFAFNYDIPKLQVSFKDPKTGKLYTRTYKNLPAGTNFLGTVQSRVEDGEYWKLKILVSWIVQCGNYLPHPFEAIIWIPKAPSPVPIIKRIEIPKPYAVTVDKNVIVQQLVPTLNDIELVLPPAEHGQLKLTVVGNMEAGRRWEYRKDFWDHFLDFFRVAALPIAELIHKAPSISLNNSSSSSSSASASASASAAAAAAAGGN